MQIKIKYLSLILLSLFFVSCNSTPQSPVDKENSFARLLPKCQMNSSIRFLPVNVTFKSTKGIFLDIGNYAQDTVVFPLDYNVKMYSYDTTNSGQWVTIENKDTYFEAPDQKIELKPISLGPENAESVDIFPALNDNSLTTVRVVVTNDSPDNCFGACIEIEVGP